jgi:hypothetical protein
MLVEKAIPEFRGGLFYSASRTVIINLEIIPQEPGGFFLMFINFRNPLKKRN